MYVVKRDGRKQPVSFDKIMVRLDRLANPRDIEDDLLELKNKSDLFENFHFEKLDGVDAAKLTQKVNDRIHPGISTSKLDEEAAKIASNLETQNINYGILSKRILVSNLHKNTSDTFSENEKELYTYGIIADYMYYISQTYADIINHEINYKLDYNFTYFGFKTLERLYLLKDKNGKCVERPQHLWMRVALALFKEDVLGKEKGNEKTNFLREFGDMIHQSEYIIDEERSTRNEEIKKRIVTTKMENIDFEKINKKLGEMYYNVNPDFTRVFKLYHLMSQGYCTQATPILFNSGTRTENFASCFVAGTDVCTINDGIKNIEDVDIGDQIITHKGNIKSVKQIHKNKLNNRQIYNIKCSKTPSIKVTGNHRFWSISKEQLKWEEKPQWNSIECLRAGDYISIPQGYKGTIEKEIIDIAYYLKHFRGIDNNTIYDYEVTKNKIKTRTFWKHQTTGQYSKSRIHNTINRYIVIDEDFCKFLGIWYGDGCVYTSRNSRKEKFIYGMSIVSHKDNKKLIDFCTKYIEKSFGLKPGVYEHKGLNENLIKIDIRSRLLGNIFAKLFGRGFNGKKLYINAYKWKMNLVKELFIGLVSSDGCFTKTGSIILQLNNIKFMKSLYFLGRNIGIDLAYTQLNNLDRGATQLTGKITIPKWFLNPKDLMKYYEDKRLEKFGKTFDKYKEKKENKLVIESATFVRLSKKNKVDDKPKFVYTLGIEDDHSYVVEGILAENCYLAMLSSDSVSGMYDDVASIAKLFKSAGGIGYNVQNLRGHGALINTSHGEAEGIVPLARVINDTSRHVKQGGRRNGSLALYTEPWHIDIEDFLELKKPQGEENARARDLFYALWIPDEFFRRCIRNDWWYLMTPDECPGLDDCWGEKFEKLYQKYINEGRYRKKVKALKILEQINDIRTETGSPYMLAKDTCNRKSNQQNLGTIRSSNLCVTPNTYILTDKGYQKISTLKNKNVNVWNGFEFSQTIVKKTGTNQQIIKVTFSDGSYVKCTEYHKFYIQEKYVKANYHTQREIFQKKKNIKDYEAKDLKVGMKLVKCEFPIIRKGKTSFLDPYTHGLFCANGTYGGINKNIPKLSLYGEKKKLVGFVKSRIKPRHQPQYDKIDCRLNRNIASKFTVPFGYDLNTKLRWFEGYCDGSSLNILHCRRQRSKGGRYPPDGTIGINGDNESLQIACIHKNFLYKVKLMLNEMGINPKVTKNKDVDMRQLPDGKGGSVYYQCQKIYRLLVTSVDLYKLCQLGFSPKRLKITNNKPNRDTRHFVKVKSIKKLNKKSDTYCFNEPNLHMGIFNGVFAGNCSEIVLYSSPKETAVCVLASVALSKLVVNNEFDFEKLGEIVEMEVEALNRVIDINDYPDEKTRLSNELHRPIGIGVQGFADAVMKLRFPFESEKTRILNRKIFETMYYHALKKSMELSKIHGPYSTFDTSPSARGILQFDLWDIDIHDYSLMEFEWDKLKEDIIKHGLRNSTLIALMPTASTSIILGNGECFEIFTSNLYKRKTLAGEFTVLNKYLVRDLEKLVDNDGNGLWNQKIKNLIIAGNGSIQHIPQIPKEIKELYKTVWEIKQRVMVDLAVDRGPFVCQSQSMNLYFENPDHKTLNNATFYAWKQGLKTLCYYTRTRPASDAVKFTIDYDTIEEAKELQKKNEPMVVCTDDVCTSCSA